MKIRCFFALPFKQAVVRRLADHADSLCQYDSASQMRWVDSDNYHLTLCFLGDVSLEQVEQLEQLANQVLSQQDSFQLHLSACEYYRINSKQALVVALPEPEPRLSELRQRVIDIIDAAGIPVRQQDFKPHVTLGRIAADQPFDTPDSWPPLDLLWLVDSVVLYQSKLGEKGALYTPLFDVPLFNRA